MSSSEESLNDQNVCTFNEVVNSKKVRPIHELPDCVPSTSAAPYEQPLCSAEDFSCTGIRNMCFLKNSCKHTAAPSEQFLTGVNCAVIKLLQEIEENHKLCAKRKPNKPIPANKKRRKPKS